MNDVPELIHAIADLLWPAIVIFVLWAYKPEVVQIMRRMRLLTNSTGASDDALSRRERLAKLKADGAVSKEEFEAQKQQILGNH